MTSQTGREEYDFPLLALCGVSVLLLSACTSQNDVGLNVFFRASGFWSGEPLATPASKHIEELSCGNSIKSVKTVERKLAP